MISFKHTKIGIPLNGVPAGRAGGWPVLPNEKHKFSAGCELQRRAIWQAALLDGPVVCTLRWAEGLPFSAARPALSRSTPDCLFVQPAGLPFCAARRKFTFFIWKHGSPAHLAL